MIVCVCARERSPVVGVKLLSLSPTPSPPRQRRRRRWLMLLLRDTFPGKSTLQTTLLFLLLWIFCFFRCDVADGQTTLLLRCCSLYRTTILLPPHNHNSSKVSGNRRPCVRAFRDCVRLYSIPLSRTHSNRLLQICCLHEIFLIFSPAR